MPPPRVSLLIDQIVFVAQKSELLLSVLLSVPPELDALLNDY